MDGSLDDVLASVEVTGTVFVFSEFTKPWGLTIDAEGRTFFHIVTEGMGWLEVEGVSEPMRLGPGDFVILPHGSRHVMRDDPSTVAPALDSVLAESPPGADRKLRWGGGGERTRMLCGEFCFPDRTTDPLLHALPPCIRVSGHNGRAAPWLQATMDWVEHESENASPGARAVLDRLTDILFIQGVRSAFQSEETVQLGWLRGLKDPEIGRALAAIHREPAKRWTVSSLAHVARLSRSAFAARFRELVEESPMRYLTRWRMCRAAALLRSTEGSIADVTSRVGYASEVAFSKAFKRHTGLAPGVYRKAQRLAEPSP